MVRVLNSERKGKMAKRNCVLIAWEQRGQELSALYWNSVEARLEWIEMDRRCGTVFEH